MKSKEARKALFCHECAFEPHCPYSAYKIYLRDRAAKGYRGWPLNVLRDDLNEGGVTASFTMSAFNESGRRTVVQGTNGIVRAVEGQIRVLDFLHGSRKEVTVELSKGTADR